MATLPKYSEWMEATNAGMFHTRSAELKFFDDSLRRYEQGKIDKSVLRWAFNVWLERAKRLHNNKWWLSVRNQPPHLMVSRVYNFFNPAVYDEADRTALAALAEMRKAVVQQYFRNASFDVKNFEGAATVASGVNDLRRIAGNTVNTAKALSDPVGSASQEMVRSMFGTGLDQVRDNVIHGSVSEALVHFVPIMGQFAGAAKVIAAWGRTAWAKYREVTNFGLRPALSKVEDVTTAFEALCGLMQRETARQRNNALITTGQFAVDLGLSVVGGAAFSGAASAVLGSAAKLAYKLHLLGMEYQETCQGDDYLHRSRIDEQLFRVCPLAGAYFIAGADDYVLINMVTVEFGSDNWMGDVELLKPSVTRVRQNAVHLMDKSVFKITGVPSPHVARTLLGSTRLGTAEYRWGQINR